MRLFHVSERGDIESFSPRVAPTDPDAREAVWAIDEDHLGNQLLPRDCPRVCFRAGPQTAGEDVRRFLFGDPGGRVVAVESAWWSRVQRPEIWVYDLPPDRFALVDQTAGYYVADVTVVPLGREKVEDVPKALLERGYEFRAVPSLWSLRAAVIASTLNFSVIRWRNASPPPATSP
jgi:hypothetical protein